MITQCEPWLGEEEILEVTNVLRSNWITEGERTAEFERRVAGYCGAKHAISCSNCTLALYVGLKALGIGDGDEVIVPDFTFYASASSVKMAGAEPVLVDISLDTFNIDPELIEKAITSRTKAIMPVHLYGLAAEMDIICKIAERHHLFIIEDAAEAIGSRLDGKHAGAFGDIGCLSFYGNKTITTGEGGIILTNRSDLAEKCLILKNHGRTQAGGYYHDYLGFNFRMTDIQSAIGLVQLSKLDTILRKKKHIRAAYSKELAGVNGLTFPREFPGYEHAHWFTNILLDAPQELASFLQEQGIATRRFFYPLHLQPCLKQSGEFPNSVKAYETGLSLPSSATLTDEQISFVCEMIKRFMGPQNE